jgi:hypothetical protein
MLAGRTTGLPIYDVHLSKLKGTVGDIVETVINSIKVNDDKDLIQGYRQPTNHEDRLGNLPTAPGNGVAYREYYIPKNDLPKAAFARLVADLTNSRLYITPTHYDVWIVDRSKIAQLDTNALVDPGNDGAQNPFFLIKTKL